MSGARFIAGAVLLLACGSSAPPSIEIPAEGGAAEVGGSGATVRHGGVTLSVPAGSLAAGTKLSISPEANHPATEGIASGVYALGPAGTTFATPATLAISYREDAKAPESLRLAFAQDGAWVEAAGSQVDTARHTVSAPVSHLSTWAVIAGVVQAALVPDAAQVAVDDTLQLGLSLRDASGNALHNRLVTWSSSNAAAATISPLGLLTALAAGESTITAASGGVSATAKVSVAAVPSPPIIVTAGAVTTATEGSASVAAHPGMQYRWSIEGGVLLTAAAGETAGGRNTVRFAAGLPGFVKLACVEVGAGAESSPASVTVVSTALPGPLVIAAPALVSPGVPAYASVATRPGMHYRWSASNAHLETETGFVGTRVRDQEYSGSAGGGAGLSAGRPVAQTFTAGVDGRVAAIGVQAEWGKAPDAIELSLRAVGDDGAPAAPLAAVTIPGGAVSFDDMAEFGGDVRLVAGTRYAIVISVPETAANASGGWSESPEGYAAGEAWVWDVESGEEEGDPGFAGWVATGADLFFRVDVWTDGGAENRVRFVAQAPGAVLLTAVELNAANLAGDPAHATATAVEGPNIMFVTSQAYPPTLPSLAAYDAKCAERATAAHLPGTYRAWLSSATEPAPSRLSPARGWVRTDGRPVADSIGSMLGWWSGHILYPPRLDEFGHDVGSRQVMTATDRLGRPYGPIPCGSFVEGGFASGGNARWTEATYSRDCSSQWPIYCFGVDLRWPVAVAPAQGRIAFIGGEPSRTGIAAADETCATFAANAGLTGSYKALLADVGTSAASRFDFSGPPWVRLDGVAVVERAQDLLFGNLLASISVDARGFGSTYDWVYTGAQDPVTQGTEQTTCRGWTSTAVEDRAVLGSATDSTSRFFSDQQIQCASRAVVYCLEE